VGGGFSGLLCARDLGSLFDVTVVDAKEFFEYTPGILRAYVKPEHFDALSFTLAPVLEKKLQVKFIWGEVKALDGKEQTAKIKPMFSESVDEVSWDYCLICSGCNFNFLHKWGESLWFPTIYEDARPASAWSHLDERFIEGRRRHILEEYSKLGKLNQQEASILVCGAGFIGVEWVTELQHFFPKMKLTIIDFLPNCLGPLPVSAQKYCDRYMKKVGINTFYGIKYEPKNPDFWEKIGLPNGADETYYCMGVKASNYFMPPETLSDKGPGGGGWIHINKLLQVCTKDGATYCENMYAIGDCNFGCVGGPSDWAKKEGIPPIPKISYPGEEQAVHACDNIMAIDRQRHGGPGGLIEWCMPKKVKETWWPWGAGMFATSLGPNDACFVVGATSKPGTGLFSVWGGPCAVQKEIIEASKVDECKGGVIGFCIWHFVHHTPVHLWGDGKFK
jgi:NADH dehydrogenase FAD-containing subunit